MSQSRRTRRRLPSIESAKKQRAKAPFAAGAVALGAAALAAAPSAQAATFTVSNTNDGGAGSLRDAITQANTNPGADVVTFQASVTGTITLTTGELYVSDSVDVQGPGPGVLAVSGNDSSSIFYLYNGSAQIDVTISGLTLTNANGYGGAIFSYDENLTLDDVVIQDSTALVGGGVCMIGSPTAGSLTVRDSTITGNAAIQGGGLALYDIAQLTLENSTLSGNSAYGPGGGIAPQAQTIAIQGSVITGNYAPLGGGIYLYGGANVTIDATTISNNTASCSGGGIYLYGLTPATIAITDSTISGNNGSCLGGGISMYALTGSLSIENTTISGNQVPNGGGGGIFLAGLYGGSLSLNLTTVAENTANTAGGGIFVGYGIPTVTNSIVANNTASTQSDLGTGLDGRFEVAYSLVEDPDTATIDDLGGNIFNQDPALGALQNNGGPTATQLPQPASPVIDAGDPAFTPPPSEDQRGFARVVNGLVDMGAVEVNAGTLQFSSAASSVPENAGSTTLTVTRTGGTDNDVSATFATSDGSANAGSDYTTASGSVSFASGDATPQTFDVTILDDSLVEGDETFDATLSAPTGGATLGVPASTTVTIADVEPGVLQFSAPTYTVTEDGASIDVTVTRTNGTTGSVSVDYATAIGTAGAGDFTATSGTLTFADGDATPQTITIPILDDAIVEGDEDFTIALSNPTGGAAIGANGNATITITDVEHGTLQFSAPAYTVTEDGASIDVTVTRTNGTDGSVSVDYATAIGTAGAGDFTATSGTLTFADGDATPQTITIPILDDAIVEGDEDFTIALSNPTGGAAIGANGSATVTITDVEHGVLQFSAPAYTTGETDGLATITVTRTGGSDGEVSASYVTSDGSATAGSDYTAVAGTVTFAPGDTIPQTISVPIANDGLVEPDETFGIALSAPVGGATLGANSSATVTITDVSPGELQFGAPTYTVSEDGATLDVTVTRTNGTSGSVGVDYATASGTAGAGDFTAVSGTLTFADGDATPQTITIPILDDAIVEGDEDFTIALTNPTNGAALGGISSTTVTITDVEHGVLQFSAPAYTAGETDGLATITVTRTGGADGEVSASYVTSDGTATAGSDYTAVAGTVTFAAGDATPKTISVPIANDGLVEPDETFGIALSAPVGGATLGANSSATVTITDVSPGELQFGAPTYTVSEDGASLDVTVTRTNGTSGSVSVDYATASGTAGAGDFTAVSGTLTFADGDATPQTITIPILDDAIVEGDENFTIALTNPTNGAALGGISSATVTISDAEAGTIQFDSATYSAGEGDGTVAISVSRTGGSDGAVSVQFATGGGTATASVDYTPASGTLTFADGETGPKSFTITLVNDADPEPTETVGLTLSNPTGGATLGAQSTATLDVVDDEADVTEFTVTSFTIDEGGVVTLTIQRNGFGPASVDYSTVDGTATGGADFQPASGTLTFPSGSSTQTVQIQIDTDALVEGAETFTVVLSNPVPTTVGNDTAPITINAAAAAPAQIPTTGELGRMLLAAGLALAGLFAVRRGRMFVFLLAMLMAVTFATPPAHAAQRAAASQHAERKAVRESRREGKMKLLQRSRGVLASIETVAGKTTLTFEDGSVFSGDAKTMQVRDVRADARTKKQTHATVASLAPGQHVVVVMMNSPGQQAKRPANARKPGERMRVRIVD